MPASPLLLYSPFWYFTKLDGLPASGGKAYFFESDNPTIPKPVYQDFDLTVPWDHPITLDASGKQSDNGTWYPIIGEDDAPYYIRITDSNNVTIGEMYGYPDPNSGNIILLETDIQNYIINGQFFFDYAKTINTSGDRGFSNLQAAEIPIAPGNWYFEKDNTTATNDIVYVTDFSPGQTQVPNNPKAYIRYFAGVPGTGEATKRFRVKFNSVRQFANETVNLQFQGISPYQNQITISTTQYFGAAGSATVDEDISGITLTTSWANNEVLIEVPSISSKTIDPNGGDYLAINFDLPLNTICDVSLTNIIDRFGNEFVPFQEESVDITQANSIALQYPLSSTVNPADGCYDPILPQGSFNLAFIPRAGKMQLWINNIAPDYSFLCNGLPKFGSDYYNLGQKCWDSSQLKLAWGTGPAGFVAQYYDSTNALTSAFAVNATASSVGVAAAAVDGNSGLGIVSTVTGTPSVAAQFTVFAKPGADIPNNSYFLYNSPSTGYFLWFNNSGSVPSVPGRTAVPVVYTGTETAAEIAALIQAAIVAGFTATLSQNAVQGTCFSNGTVTAIADNNTTFPVVQISAGGVSTPGIAGIVCLAGSAIVNGSYLTLESPSQEYYLWFAKNNQTQDPANLPALSGKKGIKVVYDGTETSAEIAQLVAAQWSIAQYRLPDVRGLSPRFWQNGATAVLPYASTIKITSLGNDGAVTFSIEGLDEDGNPYGTPESLVGSATGTPTSPQFVTSARTYSAITSVIPSANTNATGTYIGIDGEAILPTPSKITITSIDDETLVNFDIVGLGTDGTQISESLAGGDHATVTSVNTYVSVLSITPDANTTDAITVGNGTLNYSICLSQQGTSGDELIINGQYSLIGGIAPQQTVIADEYFILNGILARDPDYYARLPLYYNSSGTLESASGDNTGSLQLNESGPHDHTILGGFVTDNGTNQAFTQGNEGNVIDFTLPPSGHESRGQNVNINLVVYY
jgi:hypothetical protein